MNFFKITAGTATRSGKIINTVERLIQTEADWSKIRDHFGNAYRGFDVKVEAIETFEIVNTVPKEADKPKDLAPGEQHVETIYNVKEINIALTDEQKAMVKEINEIEDQLRKKEETLLDDLKESWKGRWWTDNYYAKKFIRKGRDVYLTDVKIQWPVIISKVTKSEDEAEKTD